MDLFLLLLVFGVFAVLGFLTSFWYKRSRRKNLLPSKQTLHGQTPHTSMNEIIPGLFLGDKNSVYEAEKYGIKNILNLTPFPDPPSITSKTNSKQIPVHDSLEQNIAQYFPVTNQFIGEALDRRQEKVLVHCEAGISRSATVVAAYLMEKYGITAQQALDLIASKRPVINPNISFRHQLQQLELR